MNTSDASPPVPATVPPEDPDGTVAQRSALRRWSLAALLTNAGIVVTGGLVRVTGSGLGCPQWPACQEGSVVPVVGAEPGWHQAIEFGNRLLTFVVLVAVVGAWWVARRLASSAPGRATAVRLGSLLVAGVLAQAVLGGITVRLDLHPGTVAAHFLLSMVLLAVATLLHRHATAEPTDPRADGRVRLLARVVPLFGAVVLVLGTVVTAAGPHAGDPGTPRLDLPIVWVARSHSAAVWLTVLATVAVLVRARARGAARVARAATLLLAVELAQAAIGYWQYITGVPARLVVLHMALATVFWIAVVRVGASVGPAPVPTGGPPSRDA